VVPVFAYAHELNSLLGRHNFVREGRIASICLRVLRVQRHNLLELREERERCKHLDYSQLLPHELGRTRTQIYLVELRDHVVDTWSRCRHIKPHLEVLRSRGRRRGRCDEPKKTC
jgi:hypothetical protein